LFMEHPANDKIIHNKLANLLTRALFLANEAHCPSVG
jgi:hypothetical protein